jgi:hypothetical protein
LSKQVVVFIVNYEEEKKNYAQKSIRMDMGGFDLVGKKRCFGSFD